MLKSKILCIIMFVIFINCIYSQNDIVFRYKIDLYNENNNIGFSVNVPENWVSIKNDDSQSPIWFIFYMENRIGYTPFISITVHDLTDATDVSLRYCVDVFLLNISRHNNRHNITQIERDYTITGTGSSFTYDIDLYEDTYSYYGRSIFFRYNQYGIQINLLMAYEKDHDLLIILEENNLLFILDELVNSIIFVENK